MKMIFLKRFNEAKNEGEKCDFQTFKELMFDISDYYDCEFNDYSDDNGEIDDPFYDCNISIKRYVMDEDDINSVTDDDVIETIADYDDPHKTKMIIGGIGGGAAIIGLVLIIIGIN